MLLLWHEVLEIKNEFKLLMNERFTFDIEPRSEYRWTGKPFTVKYDDNANNGYVFGHKYSGYIITIENSDGEIVYKRSTKSSWLDDLDRISAFRSGSAVILK